MAVSSIHQLEIHPGKSPKVQLMTQQLTRKVYIFLVTAAADVVREYKKQRKVTNDANKLFTASYGAIDWDTLVSDIKEDFAEVALLAGNDGLAQLDLKEFDAVDSFAANYSQSRAAELVGKRYEDGKLVSYPKAHYNIAKTTKDDLRSLMVDEKHKDESELIKKIEDSPIFSRTRAALIATTELAAAQFLSHIAAWKLSDIIQTVKIVLSPSHLLIDECDDAVDIGPYTLQQAPSLPLHPRCECGMEVVELK